jgi:acetyl esterase/lipase
MSTIIVNGRFSHKARGLWNLTKISWAVLGRRLLGRPLEPEWSVVFEIGTLFYRAQFNHAFSLGDMAEARAYFDAVYTVVDANLPVSMQATGVAAAKGHWIRPLAALPAGCPTVLYLHGGGYTFYAKVTQHFMLGLSHALQLPLFALDYRLTPEHPYPAQLEDAVAAYRYLLAQGIAPEKIVIAGDSAGGQLVLNTLLRLRQLGLPQPAIGIALSPWTDSGLRGASQFGNDVYDMVQGYQTRLFSRWLKAGTRYSDHDVSPMGHPFNDTAPVYLQAGGKEILVDMIRDFAHQLQQQGAPVMLDVWPHMTHEFHAYGDTLPESRAAIARIKAAITWSQQRARSTFPAIDETEVSQLSQRVPAVCPA